jgi:nucleotide-binding universal stress UspA family protein
MTLSTSSTYEIAVRDFQRARREAALQQILARLRGKSDVLLCYDDVRRHLRAGPPVERGLQEIPLDKIGGSVGRYHDFTRTFLPTKDSNQERWARVKAAVTDMKQMPPIEVYQIGEVYFVIDGNHRVSVARQLGSQTISAYVTEVQTRVPLTAADDPAEVICKAHYADFLEKTNLDKLRPEADLLMTFCGQYQVLLDQIEIECRLLPPNEAGDCHPAAWEEAAVIWYDQVYLPIVQIIRELGLLRRFPERTEADIYVLLSERREELEEALGWHIHPETAIPELVDQTQSRPLLNRVLELVAPGLEEGPLTGRWRQKQLILHREHHLFENILVLLEGIEGDWHILDQVIRLARTDDDHILGLYVVPNQAALNESVVQEMRAKFEQRCQAAGLRAEFAVEIGRVNQVIIERAAWVDLVVINLTDPPESHPLARLRSGWGEFIQRCPRPILAIPNAIQSPQDRVLLAYDGSPKADEALFIATYLTIRWQKALTVLTVKTAHTTEAAMERARDYLQQHGINWAEYILREGSINQAILETAEAHHSNLLIMGGFGWRPVFRLVLGSTVEHLLREFKQPMLICR